MKHVKKVLVLLLSAWLAMNMSGCNFGTVKYDAYTVLQKDTPEAQIVYPMPNTNEISGPAIASVTVNGVTYIGKYVRSSPTAYYFNINHSYKGNGFEFDIRESDGQFAGLYIEHTSPATDTLEEDSLKKIADEIADDYIALNNCRVTREFSDDGLYRCWYQRKLQGYITAEQILVSLRSDGKLERVAIHMQGTFDNVKRVEIDEEKADKLVNERLDEIFQSRVSNGWKSSYDISKELMRVANNQCALRYDVDIEFERADGLRHGEIVTLLVIVDHEKYNPFKP